MEVIENAKRLGESLVRSNEYKRLEETKSRCREKADLTAKLNEFNLQRGLFETESGRKEKDMMLVDALSARVDALYKQLNEDPVMRAYQEAEAEVAKLIRTVNMTIASYLGTDTDAGGGEGCSPQGCEGCQGCR